MRFFLFILVISTSFLSCKQQTKTLTGYTGNPGEIIVVVSDAMWNGGIGTEIKKHLAQDYPALPQPEPYFDLVHIPKQSFSKIFQTHRNILIVNISNKFDENNEKFEVKKSLWAKDQIVVTIEAPSAEKVYAIVKEKMHQLPDMFRKKEVERLIRRNKKFGNEIISDKLMEEHKISIVAQKDAYLADSKKNFAWIRVERERPLGGFQHQISQGILIYYRPYSDTLQLEYSQLLAAKDSITKKYVPGPSEGSYMITSNKLFRPEFREIEFKGQYATEVRGLWRMENNFMGGPFVSITTVDEKNNRLITFEGYVFAPQFNKREYIREIEAMIYSMAF